MKERVTYAVAERGPAIGKTRSATVDRHVRRTHRDVDEAERRVSESADQCSLSVQSGAVTRTRCVHWVWIARKLTIQPSQLFIYLVCQIPWIQTQLWRSGCLTTCIPSSLYASLFHHQMVAIHTQSKKEIIKQSQCTQRNYTFSDVMLNNNLYTVLLSFLCCCHAMSSLVTLTLYATHLYLPKFSTYYKLSAFGLVPFACPWIMLYHTNCK